MTRYDRLIVLSWVVLTAASIQVSAAGPPEPDTAQAQLLVRERATGDHSLLLGLDGPNPFDEARLELPVSWPFRSGQLPQGWTLTQDNKRLIARGQPMTSVRLRFDTTPPGRDTLAAKISQKKVVIDLFVNGRRTIHAEITATIVEKVTIASSLDGRLVLPRQATVGDHILASADGMHTKGSWEAAVNGQTFPLTPLPPTTPGASDLMEHLPTKHFFFDELRPIAPGNGGIRFRYTDEWGDTTIDAPATEMIVSSSAPGASCAPLIAGNTPRAFAGQTVCVSGCFPQPSWAGLTIDGQQPAYPVAASMTTLRLWLSDKLEPGPHEIRWAPSVNGAGGTATFRVLGLLGSIDQNLLWRGQSTTMRLQLIGTEEALPLQVINRTPAIIDVEGGASQTVTSSGGAVNAVQRNVRGIRRGDFAIDYELVDDSCGLSGPMRK